MASVSLQPNMNDESKELQLEDGLLEQLKDKYCCRVKVRSSSSSSDASEQTVKKTIVKSSPCGCDCRRR